VDEPGGWFSKRSDPTPSADCPDEGSLCYPADIQTVDFTRDRTAFAPLQSFALPEIPFDIAASAESSEK
jgi:hypothetical protein